MSRNEIPTGMSEVSGEEFFARLKADGRDIMPRLTYPEFTTWETRDHRTVWGWSSPGWRNPGEAKLWAVAEGVGD